MCLICNGIVIDDDRVISSYGITNWTVIYLVLLLRGGARTRRTVYVDPIPYLMTDTSSDEDSGEDSDEDSDWLLFWSEYILKIQIYLIKYIEPI